MSAIGGGDICGLMGLVNSAMTLYPEEVILDHDAYYHIYEVINSKRLSEIDPALDVIRDVGQRGHFLAQKHTRDQIRQFRISTLRDKKGPDNQPLDPREVALEVFKEIDASHKPEPLPDMILSELDKILETAEREAGELFGQ
jgi:trimethylamine:corrinoid methyltransferase-like protein